MDTTGLMYWIQERWNVKQRRTAGLPPPWSDDPIFQNTSFCNVHREDDRGTRWVAENWRTPHADDADLWFSLLLYRRCSNEPLAMERLGYPVPFDPERYLAACRVSGSFRQKAYRMMLHGKGKGRMANQNVEYVLTPAWERREYFRPRAEDSLATYYARLCELDEVSPFFAAQVIADLKYVKPLADASDWMSFAVSGPGSRRAIWRLWGHELKNIPDWSPDIPDEEFAEELSTIREALDPIVQSVGIARLTAQDWQSSLCEFDKYCRVREFGTKKGRRYRNPSR